MNTRSSRATPVPAVSEPAAVPAALTPGAFGLYDCKISHARRSVVSHKFSNTSPMWVLDVDRVPVLPRFLRFIGNFSSRDHWGDPQKSLRDNLQEFLAGHGIGKPSRILMLTGARSFGHCFNPLSVYWCYDMAGRRTQIVAEVHNTYSGRHAYLLAADESGRAEVTKDFYVSPFFTADGSYRMRISEPGEHLDVVIALQQDGVVPFTAALHGQRREATRWTLFSRPLAQLRVSALIRLHGILLWKKGVKVQPRTGTAEIDRTVAGNVKGGSCPISQ